MKNEKIKTNSGITIIEIVIGITLFVIIAGITIVSFNPAGQFARARNSEREMHLTALMIAVKQNIAESISGSFNCVSGPIPVSSAKMASASGSYNIAPCLVPNYISVLPYDPKAAGAHYAGVSDYDTGYFIAQTSSTTSTAITISAPSAELGQIISISR
ncbi:MAG: hypothetical protein AAB686_00180 [Patescibacteria group bacterium]